jgi:hypothetical protein
MTTHYSIRIVGLHYAANPTYRKEMGTVPEMEKHTVDVLRELDRKRPKVMLMPERDNQWDPHAVMARAKGERIGYVERADQEIMHKLLKGSSKHFLIATIDSVEVEERGNLHVILQAEEEADKADTPWKECSWPEWPADRPLLPVREVWNTRYEAEHMIEMLWPMADSSMTDELECYLDLWMKSSLYDISNETFQTCNRYIGLFASASDPRIRQWADRLKKYRTAFYGAKRDAFRMEWWESLQESESMELLWSKWLFHCSYHLHRGLKEIDDYLRLLPDQLYSLIGTPDKLFKSLFYRAVPRQTLWGIYTALLLRIRTCREMDFDMRPLPGDSFFYGHVETDTEEVAGPSLPEALQTEEAMKLRDKLMKASLVDKRWQPVGLTFTEKGTLIEYIADKLGIRSKWKLFGTLWNVDAETLRTSKTRGLEQEKTWMFRSRLEAL